MPRQITECDTSPAFYISGQLSINYVGKPYKKPHPKDWTLSQQGTWGRGLVVLEG